MVECEGVDYLNEISKWLLDSVTFDYDYLFYDWAIPIIIFLNDNSIDTADGVGKYEFGVNPIVEP